MKSACSDNDAFIAELQKASRVISATHDLSVRTKDTQTTTVVERVVDYIAELPCAVIFILMLMTAGAFGKVYFEHRLSIALADYVEHTWSNVNMHTDSDARPQRAISPIQYAGKPTQYA